MNKPEEVEKARRRARAMNGIKSGAQESALLPNKPFIYADKDSILVSDHTSDLEYANKRIRDGSGGSIKQIAESTRGRPTHGGRIK